jgi:hypothetical protein
MPPGLLAAPFGSWHALGILLEFDGGGRACALLAEGDEQPGGEDGARVHRPSLVHLVSCHVFCCHSPYA